MPKNNRLKLCLLALVTLTAIVVASLIVGPRGTTAATSGLVPLELVLLVDTSGSVDENEYQLQQDGYVEAFRDSDITEQIETMGGIAVVYIEWDAADNQTVRIPWTHLRTRDDCVSFSNAIQTLPRVTSGTTMIAPALAFAKAQLDANDFMGMRRVIDVSGDGLCKNWRYYKHGVLDKDIDDPAHYGTPWEEVIPPLSGTIINGVFIGSAGEHLDFYNDILPQGVDSFNMHAVTFGEFANTVKEKIMREVTTRIPGTYD